MAGAGSKTRKMGLKLFSDEFLAYAGAFGRRIEIFVIFGLKQHLLLNFGPNLKSSFKHFLFL